jgi:glycosyltransferase involved in cell wall biosynthesis
MATKLRVLHCLRAPVGGLFRHVLDLARAQVAAGCAVGIIADELTGGDAAAAELAAIAPQLALGITRVKMPRAVGLDDYTALLATQTLAAGLQADVLHGHGAKGGAYARLAARRLRQMGRSVRVLYTPHGGSLHFAPGSPQGLLFLGLERQLAKLTDGLIFESDYSRRVYETKIGEPPCPSRVVPNGLLPAEFTVHQPIAEAADVLFVGELRALKGVDVLLDALARTTAPHLPTALIVGSGPDEGAFRALAQSLGLGERVQFAGAMPAPRAFPRGRLLVVPSRAESFPYIVLEGAAAGVPMLLSDVGGIPEITAGTSVRLVPPGDVMGLSVRLSAFLTNPAPMRATTAELRARVASRFTVARMAADILDFYQTVAPGRSPGLVPAQILMGG